MCIRDRLDPMRFPPIRPLRAVPLSPTQMPLEQQVVPSLDGGAIDDPDYQKTLKHTVSIRPRHITGAQVKLLVRGVPGLYNKLKKSPTDEHSVTLLEKAAADMGIMVKGEGSKHAPPASSSAAALEGPSRGSTTQQRSKSTPPRKDRETGQNKSARSSSASSNTRAKPPDVPPPENTSKSEAPVDSPPFHSLQLEEWNVPVVQELHLGQPGLTVAMSDTHANSIIQSCAGTKERAGFLFSSPIQEGRSRDASLFPGQTVRA
eukprot:2020232-Amphidinium_carterae.2